MKNLTVGGVKVHLGGEAADPIYKIWKSLIQNGGPNTHPKFQHSNSIRMCSKIGGAAAREEKKKKHILHWLLVHFDIFQSLIKTSISDI